MPRVVTAGVPSGDPTPGRANGVSNGTVFLLQVMLARSSMSCAFLAVSSGRLLRRSTRKKVIVGAAGDDLVAARGHRGTERFRVFDDLRRVGLELGFETLAEAHGLGGD